MSLAFVAIGLLLNCAPFASVSHSQSQSHRSDLHQHDETSTSCTSIDTLIAFASAQDEDLVTDSSLPVAGKRGRMKRGEPVRSSLRSAASRLNNERINIADAMADAKSRMAEKLHLQDKTSIKRRKSPLPQPTAGDDALLAVPVSDAQRAEVDDDQLTDASTDTEAPADLQAEDDDDSASKKSHIKSAKNEFPKLTAGQATQVSGTPIGGQLSS